MGGNILERLAGLIIAPHSPRKIIVGRDTSVWIGVLDQVMPVSIVTRCIAIIFSAWVGDASPHPDYICEISETVVKVADFQSKQVGAALMIETTKGRNSRLAPDILILKAESALANSQPIHLR